MVRGTILLICWCLLCGNLSLCRGQAEPQQAARKVPPAIPAMQTPVHVAGSPTLLDGTEVKLRLVNPVRIKEAKVGDSVPLVLHHAFYYRNTLLAQAGEPVEARIVEATKARWASRGSKLAIQITGLKLLNGQILPLRGYSRYNGGAGNAPHVADGTTHVASEIVCYTCTIFEPAALAFFLAPGSNKDIKTDTSFSAYVDGDAALDLSSLLPLQPKEIAKQGTVRIVRGHFASVFGRDLYCNGFPIAHLDGNHKVELSLSPGYYRFAINPKKGFLEVYVGAGADRNLITTNDQIAEMGENDINGNTTGVSANPFAKPKTATAGDLLRQAKPVDNADIYSTNCSPLEERVDAPPRAVTQPTDLNLSSPTQPSASHPN